MGAWKNLESPKLKVPLELREITPAGAATRVWEVQELRGGSMFKTTLPPPESRPNDRTRSKPLTDAEAERAVCLAVEEALLTPPDKEPGMTYEVLVGSEELAEALQTSG
jgi:hypothetical protein